MEIKSTPHGIAIEERDSEGNLFKRMYQGYTKKRAETLFKLALAYHNQKLAELTFTG